MTDASYIATGDEPAALALVGYMKWFTEERWCAGWLNGLRVAMARLDDPGYKWLVRQAGGWWWWAEGAHDVSFQSGSLADLEGVVGSNTSTYGRPLSRD